MSAVPVTISGVAYPKNKMDKPMPVTIVGFAWVTGLGVGGGPADPPSMPPPEVDNGLPPVDPVPPEIPTDPGIVKPPPPEGGWGWSPTYGWGYFPGSGSPGPKK